MQLCMHLQQLFNPIKTRSLLAVLGTARQAGHGLEVIHADLPAAVTVLAVEEATTGEVLLVPAGTSAHLV